MPLYFVWHCFEHFALRCLHLSSHFLSSTTRYCRCRKNLHEEIFSLLFRRRLNWICISTLPRLRKVLSRFSGWFVVMMGTQPSCETTTSMALRMPETDILVATADSVSCIGLCAFHKSARHQVLLMYDSASTASRAFLPLYNSCTVNIFQ